MQLSTLPSIPATQPVAVYAPPEADAGAPLPAAANDTPFAQLLPSPAPSNPGKPGAPSDKKPDTPKATQDQTTVPLYYTWLTDLAPQNVPTIAAHPAVSEAAGLAGGLGVAAKALPTAAGLSAGKGDAPSLSPGLGKGVQTLPAQLPTATMAPPPRTPSAAGPSVPAPAPKTTGVPITAAAPGKASTPVPWSGPGSAASLAAAQAAGQAAAPGVPGAPAATDAVSLIKGGGHMGAAGMAASEKIAGQAANDSGAPASAAKAADKKILSTDGKQVADADPSVGIAVAKIAPAMSTSAQTDRQPNALMAAVPVATVAASSNAGPGDTQGAVSQQGVAQRAVDAALSAAETVSSGAHQAVNMQFSVGNADLSLRVELRNGEIHTTFRTDSADLRLDLAHEWQSSNPGSGNGSLRLAEPVFTSSGSPGSMAAGENASQQRSGQGRSDASPAFSGGMGSAATPSSSVEADTPVRVHAAPSTSLHLQAFA